MPSEDHNTEQSIAHSLSELVWILLFGVVLFYCCHIQTIDKEMKLKDLQIKELGIQVEKWPEKYKEIEDLKKILEQRNETIESQKEEIKKLKEDIGRLERLIVGHIETETDLEKKIYQSKKDRDQALNSGSVIRKELLGLKGSFEKVVFVIDKSQSMKTDGRWDETCRIIESWLTYLNVGKCVFIQFNDQIQILQEKKGDSKPYLHMRGLERAKNLKLIIKQFKAGKPRGNTRTLLALKKAIEYKPDSIILFTDGAPRGRHGIGKYAKRTSHGRYDKKQMEQILKICGEEKIPVNIVALGDYFDEEVCVFLRKLAEVTEGSFTGK